MEDPHVARPPKKEPKKSSLGSKTGKGGITGGVAGAAKNAARFIIKQGGTRWYNGVTILDKTVKTAKGYPKWFARIDYATPKTPQAHINVNPGVTGLRDPHIPLSTATAQNAAKAGTALNYINKAAPVLTAIAVAYDGYQIGCNMKEDYKNGTSRNTTKKVVTTASTWGAGYGGAATGATIGTSLFPGIGTLFGGLIGGIVGGIGGNVASDYAADAAMNHYQYDITHPECKLCGEVFECRNFETGEKSLCDDCSCEVCEEALAKDEKIICRLCYETTCGWCRSGDGHMEMVVLEDGEFKLCAECLQVLKTEIQNELVVYCKNCHIATDNSGAPSGVSLCTKCLNDIKEQSSKLQHYDWNCKKCNTPMNGSETLTEEGPSLFCKICRDNQANQILETDNQTCKLTCKWCVEDFWWKKSDVAKDFCPDCEMERNETRTNTCKWCEKDFQCKISHGAKDFCPDCEAERKKNKK